MKPKRVIGIDPDAKGFQCKLLTEGMQSGESKYFTVTNEDLQKFVKWAQGLGEAIIAIEGANGQSKPIEHILRTNRIVFYSFAAKDVENYRRIFLGENKDNDRDAEAAARLALSLDQQALLSDYKRVWFPDEGLQLLTRNHARLVKNKTGEINNLWKLIRSASPDLYFELINIKTSKKGGKRGKRSIFNDKNLLNLLFSKPNLAEWKNLSEPELLEAMGGRKDRGVNDRITLIRKIAPNIALTDESIYELIRMSAKTILSLKEQAKLIEKRISQKSESDIAIRSLMEISGISVITASTIIAEIIDIRRFLKDDNLASMAGLGRSTKATGDKSSEKKNYHYNRRLKNILITAAINFVIFNPDHHLSGYFRNLRKAGMARVEAYKRVARSLVRIIFKRLYALIHIPELKEVLKKHEGSMANGKTRNTLVSSNILPSTHNTTKQRNREYRKTKVKSFEKCLT